ncbi:zeta toxin family protein [Nocardia sp. CA2R105]|uniref:zeta toxin family protein n=1 Tax=Nocardia coffeae TaxID=2873381 RepID=UPI001CA6BEE4|nr:zeta toxin family protein [Nocardia coffeae]MBY8862744.1 zeta toxin family protein [Nocardia coffeae]
MSVHIPQGFPTWLVDLVAGHLPLADTDAMRRTADAWVAQAHRLAETVQRLETVLAGHAATAIRGDTGDAIRKQLQTQLEDTKAQITNCDNRARQLYEAANSLEFEQYVVLGTAAALLVQITIDLAMMNAAKTVADRLAAEATMKFAWRNLLKWLAQQARRFAVEHPFLALVARGAAVGIVISGGVNLGAQAVQIAQGHRKSIDVKSAAVAMAAGGAGGAAGAMVGRFVVPLVSAIGAQSASKAVQVLWHIVGTIVAGGLGGAAGGIAGGTTATVLSGGKIQGRNLADMAIAGIGAGVAGAVGAGVRAGVGAASAKPSVIGTAAAKPPVGGTASAEPSVVDPTAGAGRPGLPASDGAPPTGKTAVTPPRDGQMARPEGLTPEAMGISPEWAAMGHEIEAEVLGHAPAEGGDGLPPELMSWGREAEARVLGEGESGEGPNGGGTGSDGKQPGSPPGSARAPTPTSSPPWRGGGSPAGHDGGWAIPGGGHPLQHAVAAPETARPPALTNSAVGHSNPAGSAVGHPTAEPARALDGQAPTGQRDVPAVGPVHPAQHSVDNGSAPPGHAPDGGFDQRPGETTAPEAPAAHAADSGDPRGATAAPEQTVSQDHSPPVNGGPSEPGITPADGEGGGSFVPMDDNGSAPRLQCAPYAAETAQALTGHRMSDLSALAQRATTAGVGGHDLANTMRAGWRPGGVESPKAFVDEVRRNGGTGVMGVQFDDAGAHAVVVTRNAEGHIEIHERVGDVARKISGDQVVETLLDEHGQPVLEMTTKVDDAVGHWLDELDAASTHVIRFEAAADGSQVPEVPLDPDSGLKSQARPGIDMPESDMGHRTPGGAATLERPPTDDTDSLLDLDFDNEFRGLAAQFDSESPVAQENSITETPPASARTDTPVDNPAPPETPSSTTTAETTTPPGHPAPDTPEPVAQQNSATTYPDVTPSAHHTDEASAAPSVTPKPTADAEIPAVQQNSPAPTASSDTAAPHPDFSAGMRGAVDAAGLTADQPSSDEVPDAPPVEFTIPEGDEIITRVPGYIPNPAIEGAPELPMPKDAPTEITFDQGDYVVVPGVSGAPEPESARETIPTVPHLPWTSEDRPTELPGLQIPGTLPGPGQGPEQTRDANTRPAEFTPPTRYDSAPPTHLPALPEKPPAEQLIPDHITTPRDPNARDAPQDPAPPRLNPDDPDPGRISDPSAIPGPERISPWQLAPPPPGPVVPIRPVPWASAAPEGGKRRKKQPPQAPAQPRASASPPPESSSGTSPSNDLDSARRDPAAETAIEPVREVLADWPDAEQSDTAVAIARQLVRQTGTRQPVAARIQGEPGNRWLTVEVTDPHTGLPVRPGENETGWPAVELMDEQAGTWGFTIRPEAGRTVWFRFFESVGPEDPSLDTSVPDLETTISARLVEPVVGVVRDMITELAERNGWPDDQIESVNFAISEFLQNAGRHARGGPARLRLRRTGDVLVAGVSDTSRDLPTRPPEANFEAAAQVAAAAGDLEGDELGFGLHGRGLATVEALVTEWGVSLARVGGKEVWVAVDLPASVPTASTNTRSPGVTPWSATAGPGNAAAKPSSKPTPEMVKIAVDKRRERERLAALNAVTDLPDGVGWRQLRMPHDVELGKFFYQLPQSREAAIGVLNRLHEVLTGLHPDATPEQIDDAFYAYGNQMEGGMVPRSVSLDELRANGNTRELMAAILNALRRNLETDHAAGTTLDEGIANLLNQPDAVWEATARRLHLDVAALGRLRANILEHIRTHQPGRPITEHDVRAVEHAVVPGPEAADSLTQYNQRDDAATFREKSPADGGLKPYGEMLRKHLTVDDFTRIGKPLSPQELAAINELRKLRKDRLTNEELENLPRDSSRGNVDVAALEAELQAQDPTVRYVLPLYKYDEHNRDRRVRDAAGNAEVSGVLVFHDEGLINAATALQLDPDRYAVELPWRPGTALFRFNRDDPWFLETAVEQGFPLTGAVSGTSARFMARFDWIAPTGVSRAAFAGAVIGFVMPEHHSLPETLHGLRMVDVPIIDNSAFATPAKMYSATYAYAEQLGYPRGAWRPKVSPASTTRGADAAPADPRLEQPREGSVGRRGPQPGTTPDGTKAVPSQGVSGHTTPAPAQHPAPVVDTAGVQENQCAVVMLQDLKAAGVPVREAEPAEIGPAGMPLVGRNGLEDRMPHQEDGRPNAFQEIPLDPDADHSVDEIIDWVDKQLHPEDPDAQPHAQQVAVVVEFAPEDQVTVTLPDGSRRKVGAHGFLIKADTGHTIPRGDPRRVVRAFVLAFDHDNLSAELPDAVPRGHVSPRLHVGRPADSPAAVPPPIPVASPVDLDNLRAIRDAVAAQCARTAADPIHAAVTLPELEQPFTVLNELLAVQTGTHPPVAPARFELLLDFAHLVDYALVHPAEDALRDADGRLSGIEKQLKAAPTGTPVQAAATGLLDGIDHTRLYRVWEAATQKMVQAGLDADAMSRNDADQPTAADDRYWKLTEVVGRLEDFLTYVQMPETKVTHERLALLQTHFTTTAAWLLYNAVAMGEMDPAAAAVVTTFRTVGPAFHDLAAASAATREAPPVAGTIVRAQTAKEDSRWASGLVSTAIAVPHSSDDSAPDTDALAAERYELSETELQHTFDESVADAVLGKKVPGRRGVRVVDGQEFQVGLAHPVVRVLGGQPGAGKSTVLPLILSEFAQRGGVVYIGTIDTFLHFHPRYAELMALDDTATGLLMDAAWRWQQMAIDRAIALGCNVLLEQTLTNGQGVGATLARFTGASYTAELDVIAVQPHVSKHRTVLRYVEGRLSGNRKVLTPAQAHDDAVPGSAATVGQLESDDSAVRIAAVRVLGVDGEVYFRNHRTASGAWAAEPEAATELASRRDSALAPVEQGRIARRARAAYAEILARIAADPSDTSWQDLRLLAAGPAMAFPWLAHDFDGQVDVAPAENHTTATEAAGPAITGQFPFSGTVDAMKPALAELSGGSPLLREIGAGEIRGVEITQSGERSAATYLALADESATSGEQLLAVMPAPSADLDALGPALRRVLASMLGRYPGTDDIVESAALIFTRTQPPPHTYVKWEAYVSDDTAPALLRITIHSGRDAPMIEHEFALNSADSSRIRRPSHNTPPWAPRPAEPTGTPPLAWEGVDPLRVAEELKEKWAMEAVTGFDREGADPEALREIARGIDDLYTRYPGIAIRRLHILDPDQMPDPTANAKTSKHVDRADKPFSVVKYNGSRVDSPREFQERVEWHVATGYKPRGAQLRVHHSTIMHEGGHALENVAPYSHMVMPKLLETYITHHMPSEPDASSSSILAWLGEGPDALSGYAMSATDGSVNTGEAGPEAFRAGEDHALDPHSPMGTLYPLASGRTPVEYEPPELVRDIVRHYESRPPRGVSYKRFIVRVGPNSLSAIAEWSESSKVWRFAPANGVFPVHDVLSRGFPELRADTTAELAARTARRLGV